MTSITTNGWVKDVLISYACMVLWIGLSSCVIIYNKHILVTYDFPFPVALTMLHMGFSSVMSHILVGFEFVDDIRMSTDMYFRAVVPIGCLYALILSLSNGTYMFLSVSFIQMIKAMTPASVYVVGCLMGTESWSLRMAANLVVVVTGVTISAYGEIHFVLVGVVLQLIAIVLESFRLTMTQLLLQSKGIKLNPIMTLYYVAPCCFVALIPIFLSLEYRQLMETDVAICPWHLLANAIAAFGLNIASFLLLGRTSALTMNVCGVIKDWILIGLSVVIFHSHVTNVNLIGYMIAFLGVTWYNYQKVQDKKLSAATERVSHSSDNEPLLCESKSLGSDIAKP